MTGPSDDNPFILPPRASKPWAKWRLSDRKPAGRWVRAVAALALCGFGLIGAHELTQQWLISRLADDLEAHPPHVQVERIAMLSEFGAPGLPKIVAALGSPDETVSATAFRVLRDLQGRWQTSESDDAVGCQQTLLESLSELARRCPPKRRPRVAELVNQLVLDTVGADSQTEAEIYRRACELLAVVSQSTDSPSASATRDSAPHDADSAPRVAALPADPLADASPDTSPQPQLLTPLPPAASIRIVGGPVETRSLETTPAANRGSAESPGSGEESPPRQIDSEQMPRLAPLTQSSFIVTPVEPEEEMLGGNPLAAYDTRSVIDFVGSVQPALREAAEAELRKRNFTSGDLELAARLTSTSADVRLAMVEELPERADVDPRRWLIWLASDPERDVRLEAVAKLGTMDDPEVRQALRERLREERDPTVATRLRRFLGLR